LELPIWKQKEKKREESKMVQEIGFSIDGGLRQVLNSIAYNIPQDWDSVILISGSGMVRVGKSVLAQQIAKYLSIKLETPFSLDNIVFSGSELISKAKSFPKMSVFVYDEARGELDTKKVLEEMTKTLLDFFAECGMYNHVLILVLPEFFDLPKSIAISRSELLLNVFREREPKKDKNDEDVVKFMRGFFYGYHRPTKKKLYILGKKNFNDYDIVKSDFKGRFSNTFTVDKREYEAKKLEYLARNRFKEDRDFKFNATLFLLSRYLSALKMESELKSLGVGISNDTIMRHIKDFAKKNN
jgi:hypothetical protein